jgi:phosphatidylinositol glycan class O
MQPGEVFTPASEITGARKEKVVTKTPQLPKRSGPPVDEDKARRAAQIHFKASHGLITAFFTLILYVSLPLDSHLFNSS